MRVRSLIAVSIVLSLGAMGCDGAGPAPSSSAESDGAAELPAPADGQAEQVADPRAEPVPRLPSFSATVRSLSGNVLVGPAMARIAAQVGGVVPAGGRLRAFDADGTLALKLEGGGSASARGRAEMMLLPVTEPSRSVVVYEGTWLFDDIGARTLHVITPFDVAVTITESSAEISLSPISGVSVKRTASGTVSVRTEAETHDVETEPWSGRGSDGAWFEMVTGAVEVKRGGNTVPITATTMLRQRDLITLGDDSRAQIVFPDRGSLTLAPNTALRLKLLAPTGRRVRLTRGTIQESDVRGIALEVQTPTDVSLVLQNASCTATVSDEHVSFTNVAGDYTQLHDGQRTEPVKGSWSSAGR